MSLPKNTRPMKILFRISVAFNVLVIAGVVYASLFGKKHMIDFVAKNVIEISKEQKRSMFNVCPVSKGAIIFLGNSITEGGRWSELFPGKNILNRGIGGDITSGVLARMDEIVRHEPSKLFICIGTNDLAFGVENEVVIANYRSIIEKVKKSSPQTVIYVQSVFPVGKSPFLPHRNEKISPLNGEIKKMCSEMGVAYLNIHDAFTDNEGYLDSRYTNDQLPLTGAGYLVWKDVIEAYVNE